MSDGQGFFTMADRAGEDNFLDLLERQDGSEEVKEPLEDEEYSGECLAEKRLLTIELRRGHLLGSMKRHETTSGLGVRHTMEGSEENHHS